MKFLDGKIASVRAVIEFDRFTDVRYQVKEAEQSFASIIDGKLKSTDVDSQERPNPSSPRFIFKNDNLGILVSEVSTELQSGELDGGLLLDDDLIKLLSPFYSSTKGFIGEIPIENIGMIVTINFPLDGSETNTVEECPAFIFDKFITPPKSETMDKLERVDGHVRYGYRDTDGCNMLFQVTSYETRDFSEAAKAGITMVNARNYPLTAQGIEVLIDLNWRHAIMNNILKEDSALIVLAERANVLIKDELPSMVNIDD